MFQFLKKILKPNNTSFKEPIVNQSARARDGDIYQAGHDLHINSNMPTHLIDPIIAEETNKLIKTRLFIDFNTTDNSLRFGERLLNGDLSSGSHDETGRALAWCARTLAYTEHSEQAESLCNAAKKLTNDNTVRIAEAFILSKKNDKDAALQLLGEINPPEFISASLEIIHNKDSAKSVIKWMNDTGYTIHNLDSDGKLRLLSCQLTLCKWNEVKETVGALKDDDYVETPYLHHFAAFGSLINAIPEEQRIGILNCSPFWINEFSLNCGEQQLKSCKKSIMHFGKIAEFAEQFDCPNAANFATRFKLWIELNIPELRDKAKSYIESKFTGIDSPDQSKVEPTLGLVNFAIELNIPINIEKIETIIDQQVARNNGKMTLNAAFARLGIVFTKDTYEKAALYLNKHYPQLSELLTPKFLNYKRVELLSKAGMITEANEVYDLLKDDISEYESKQLQQMISDAPVDDIIEIHKANYRKNEDLNVLRQLVEELNHNYRWEEMCEYGILLFEKTNDLDAAELFTSALLNTQKSEKLVEFIKSNNHLLTHSEQIKFYYAWGLYYEGDFQNASNTVNELLQNLEPKIAQSVRKLKLFIEMNSGNWDYIDQYILNETTEKDNRTAPELLAAANLALNHNLPNTYIKKLLTEAVSKDPENPNILGAAYHTATQCKLEDDPEISSWINNAMNSTDPKSPFKSISLQELAEQLPIWDKQVQEISEKLENAELPLFSVSQHTNQSYAKLTIFKAILNEKETDLRRKTLIPAFAGNRKTIECDLSSKILLLDTSTILNLAFLDILDIAINSCKSIIIPHDTLSWLYREKQEIPFHQPKRIEEAEEINNLVAGELLVKFQSSNIVNSDLKSQIGYETAALISEAQFSNSDTEQHLVALSLPVYTVDSLLKENTEADLSKYTGIICSSYDIIAKLKQKTLITQAVHDNAIDYLKRHDAAPSQSVPITDGATIYLSSSIFHHLLHLKLLGKLKKAKITVVIPPQIILENEQLIAYEATSNKVVKIINKISTTLSSCISSEKISVGRKININKDDQNELHDHPTLDLLFSTSNCDYAAIDDRFINKNNSIGNSGINIQILTTLDILHSLYTSKIITQRDLFDKITKLRIAGYVLIPFSDIELDQFLIQTEVQEGIFQDTAELKAIKESLILVRMRDLLQLPNEITWLAENFLSFLRIMKKLWHKSIGEETSRIKTNWIFEQLDIKGWVHSFKEDQPDMITGTKFAQHISTLFLPIIDIQDFNIDGYHKWVEQSVLLPLKESNSNSFAQVIEAAKKMISDNTSSYISQLLPKEQTPERKSSFVLNYLELIPPLLEQELLKDNEFCNEFNINVNNMITFAKVSKTFIRSKIIKAAKMAWLTSNPVEIDDISGITYTISCNDRGEDIPKITLNIGEDTIIINTLPLVAEDKTIRMKCFEACVDDVNLPKESILYWQNILDTHSLSEEKLVEFQSDINDTTSCMERHIYNILNSESFTLSSLVPDSRRYYERLIGVYDNSKTINEYANKTGKQLLDNLVSCNPYEGLLQSFYLSSHSSLTDIIDIESLDSETLIKAYKYLLDNGDIISSVGAIEVGLRILPIFPELETLIVSLINIVFDDDPSNPKNQTGSLYSLFILVDSELSRRKLFNNEPPFYRRLASLTHSNLILRQLRLNKQHIEGLNQSVPILYSMKFFIQSIADMRLEPRWFPSSSVPELAHYSYINRIISALYANKDLSKSFINIKSLITNIENGDLKEYKDILDVPASHLNPLEAGESYLFTLTPEDEKLIKLKLENGNFDAESFSIFVIAANMYKFPKNIIQLVSNALNNSNNTIKGLKDSTQIFTILSNLAHIAATSKNSDLLETVSKTTLRYLYDEQFKLSTHEFIQISLINAAGASSYSEWQEIIGECFNNLAFNKSEVVNPKFVLGFLHTLLDLFPDLWLTCSKAEAALKALVNQV